MSETAKLKLSLNEAGVGQVSLNGMDIGHMVTAVEFKANPSELTEIKLTIFAEIDAEITAKLDQIALARKEPEAKEGLSLLDGRTLRLRPRA